MNQASKQPAPLQQQYPPPKGKDPSTTLQPPSQQQQQQRKLSTSPAPSTSSHSNAAVLRPGRNGLIGKSQSQWFWRTNDEPTGQQTPLEKFQEQCFEAHNHFRTLHGCPRLKWSEELARQAQHWAEHIAESGVVQYSEQTGVGENICMLNLNRNTEIRGDVVTRIWYNEMRQYDFADKPGWRKDTIHFAQVVWKKTFEMGCGMARSTKKSADFVIIVAYYRTPGNGNLPGEFAQNVPAPKYQCRFNTHDSINGFLDPTP
ncbi:putative Golgi-associated plant pathogenesis-related protein 1 [Hypsibius exemplaris]|uniref:Golgi-associated plant pathogenesis-related protein 1 n=1 Tax=Hypsibius exemplaris TaxID=2072580 RepID=A0A1W0WMQ0_HYPEX|nr:putative Golgi-associated plant pathogenesis-related protein 1 [Hypsibius exemplaris]